MPPISPIRIASATSPRACLRYVDRYPYQTNRRTRPFTTMSVARALATAKDTSRCVGPVLPPRQSRLDAAPSQHREQRSTLGSREGKGSDRMFSPVNASPETVPAHEVSGDALSVRGGEASDLPSTYSPGSPQNIHQRSRRLSSSAHQSFRERPPCDRCVPRLSLRRFFGRLFSRHARAAAHVCLSSVILVRDLSQGGLRGVRMHRSRRETRAVSSARVARFRVVACQICVITPCVASTCTR
jgi:hypothetical protein